MRLIFLAILISLKAYSADNYLYVMGGGGEPEQSYTMFDKTLDATGNFAAKRHYQTTITFNGGHKRTEEIIDTNFSQAKKYKGFTKENYDKLIKDIIKNMKEGKITEKSKLLIVISSHGGQARPNEKTHSIALNSDSGIKDLDNMGVPDVSLDMLAEVADLARKKNIKLAIIDLSCHSGSTLALANSKTCVISSSSAEQNGWLSLEKSVPNMPAYEYVDSFSDQLIKNLGNGKNLEEIFLEARLKYTTSEFPMISTPAGLEVHNLIYPMLLNYMTDVPDDIIETILNLNSVNCSERNQDFAALDELINSGIKLQDKIGGADQVQEKLKKLQALIRNYKQTHEKYIDKIKEMNDVIEKEKLKIVEKDRISIEQKCKEDLSKHCNSSMKDPSDSISCLQAKSKETSLVCQIALTKLDISFVSLEIKPEYSVVNNLRSEIVKDENFLYENTSKIGTLARELYNVYYKDKIDDNKISTPCRDFVP